MSATAFTTEIVREARREHLPALLGFAEETCASAGLGEDECMAVRLAVEEVCANVIEHGHLNGGCEIRVRLCVVPDALIVSVEDDAPLFDPASAPAPVLDAAWDERPLGGLGLHLVKQLMDEVRHSAREEGGNRLTLVKWRRREQVV